MSIKNILPGKIGLGGAPLGNMFRAIPEEEALATVTSAWDLGIRYFDTAPLYGSGLSEIRMGEALSQYPRDEFVLSTKVAASCWTKWKIPPPAIWVRKAACSNTV